MVALLWFEFSSESLNLSVFYTRLNACWDPTPSESRMPGTEHILDRDRNCMAELDIETYHL